MPERPVETVANRQPDVPEIYSDHAAGPRMENGYVNVAPNIRLYYECRGDGVPLIIINNFFMNASHWRPLTRHIATGYKVINYDLRHQGLSSKVDGDLSISDHVNDLTALVNHLNLDQVYMLGTCVSTLIARDYAINHPDKIKGTIMVGPIFSPYGDLPRTLMHRSLMASLNLGGGEALFNHYYPLLYTAKTQQANQAVGYLTLKARFLEANPDSQLRAHLNSTLKIADNVEDLKKLTAPTLLLAGEEDPLTSRRGLALLAQILPNACVELIEGTAHNPYIEATAVFEAAVVNFLRRNDVRHPHVSKTVEII